jgi:hypothetical protein
MPYNVQPCNCCDVNEYFTIGMSFYEVTALIAEDVLVVTGAVFFRIGFLVKKRKYCLIRIIRIPYMFLDKFLRGDRLGDVNINKSDAEHKRIVSGYDPVEGCCGYGNVFCMWSVLGSSQWTG